MPCKFLFSSYSVVECLERSERRIETTRLQAIYRWNPTVGLDTADERRLLDPRCILRPRHCSTKRGFAAFELPREDAERNALVVQFR